MVYTLPHISFIYSYSFLLPSPYFFYSSSALLQFLPTCTIGILKSTQVHQLQELKLC